MGVQGPGPRQLGAPFLTSKPGQDAIAGYQIDGQQVFFPNARKEGS